MGKNAHLVRPSGLPSSSAQSSVGRETPFPLNMSWAGSPSSLLDLLLLAVPVAKPLPWPLAGNRAGGPFTVLLGKPATVSACTATSWSVLVQTVRQQADAERGG